MASGAFRLASEILKWLDRKGERSHELAMQNKALEFEKLRGTQRMAEIGQGSMLSQTMLPTHSKPILLNRSTV